MATRQLAPEPGLTRRQLALRLLGVGVVLIIIFGWLWWSEVYENPTRVFWGMITSSLSTAGVTRHIVESSGGQQLDEYVQLSLGANNFAHAVTSLSQSGNVVKTETIGTPTVDYTRYTNIKTSETGKNGQPLDFSPVLGVWGKSAPVAKGQANDPLNHLFGQTLLGVVPMANLPSDERAALVQQIQSDEAFMPDFSNVAHKVVAGHHVYVYKVAIEPVAYAIIMQSFARDLGQGQPSEFNPNDYEGASAINVNFAVDPVSRQLIQISYTGTSHTETYSGYGIQPKFKLPTKAISTSQLQQRLSDIE